MCRRSFKANCAQWAHSARFAKVMWAQKPMLQELGRSVDFFLFAQNMEKTHHLWPLFQTCMKDNDRTNVTNALFFNLLKMLLSHVIYVIHTEEFFSSNSACGLFNFHEFKGRTCDDSSQHRMCLPMYKDAEIPEIPSQSSQFAILNWYGQHGHLLQTLACRARLGTCKIHCSFSPAVLQVAGPEGELSKGHKGMRVGLTRWCFLLILVLRNGL